MLDVVVVVVSHNSSSVLPGLLSSLPAGMRSVSWRLVLVDNASSDETVRLTDRLADVMTVQMGRNAGYAAAVNAGIAASPGAASYLILNPDVRLGIGACREMLAAMRTTGAGIVAPRQTTSEGALLLALRRDPTLARALGEALLGGTRAGRWHLFGEVVTDTRAYETGSWIDWASGSCMLVSRPALEDVGPWDDSFFLYSEETDFALRSRAAGHGVWYEPKAQVQHLQGESHSNPALWALLQANRVRLRSVHGGPLRAQLLRLVLLLGEGVRALLGRPISQEAFRALLLGESHRAALIAQLQGPAQRPTPASTASSGVVQ